MDDYYERYWKRSLKKDGIATLPPVWKEKDFKKIKEILISCVQGVGLDVGCGEGAFTFQLSRLNQVKKIVGVDISSAAISRAKKNYPKIRFRVASSTDLPFPKESFDFITAIELVEHVVDIEQMFREFNRVLRIGGRLFITTTDFNLLKRIIIAIFFWDRYFYPTNPHIRFFTRSTLKKILNEADFKIIKYRWNGSYFGIMPKGQIVLVKKI